VHHGTSIIAKFERESSLIQAGIKTELRSHSVDKPHYVRRLPNGSCSVCICKVCIGRALWLRFVHVLRIRIFNGHKWAKELEQSRHDGLGIDTSPGRNGDRHFANLVNVTVWHMLAVGVNSLVASLVRQEIACAAERGGGIVGDADPWFGNTLGLGVTPLSLQHVGLILEVWGLQ
jgi:hypothetical protein